MSELIKIEGTIHVNTSESTFGDLLLLNDKLIVPFFNANIIQNEESYLAVYSGKYIKFCYLMFESVSGIVWDYDLSRFLPEINRECYGGAYYQNLDYREFWLSYLKGYLVYRNNPEVSKHPWNLADITNSDLFSAGDTFSKLQSIL